MQIGLLEAENNTKDETIERLKTKLKDANLSVGGSQMNESNQGS